MAKPNLHLHDPFARSSGPPRSATREGRVELIGEAAQALLDGKLPQPEARAFLAQAILGVLEHGGSIDKAFRIFERGSHKTPMSIWRQRR